MQRTTFPYEVLVGDDASTDGTRDIVAAYGRAHPDRLIPILPERNMGLEGGRLFETLLERARGEYVALLDGDDFWFSDQKLQRQVDLLDRHRTCAVCHHNVVAFYDDGSRPAWELNAEQEEVSVVDDLLGAWNFIASSSVMVRRAAVGPLPEWALASPCADWAFYVLAALNGNIRYIDEPMSAYRLHADGMWSRYDRLDALAQKRRFHDQIRSLLAPEQMPALAYGEVKLATLTAIAKTVLDPNSIVLVISRGDPQLVELGNIEGRHFPADPHGSYSGHYPADDADAIQELAAARMAGASHLVVPRPAFWWLDHYHVLARHLQERHRRVWDDDDCTIFELLS